MTLQSDIAVHCTDKLDTYQYDLYVKGELITTEEHEDHFKYALVTILNGESGMLLRESHAEIVKLNDFSDPHTFPITITQN